MEGFKYGYKTKFPIVRRIRSGVLQRDGTPQALGLWRSTFSHFSKFAALSKTKRVFGELRENVLRPLGPALSQVGPWPSYDVRIIRIQPVQKPADSHNVASNTLIMMATFI